MIFRRTRPEALLGRHPDASPRPALWSYENRLLIILSLAEACVLFDRVSLNFLSPYFASELGLNNFQIGMLSSGVAVALALSGYFVGIAADSAGRRKPFLLGCVVLLSITSALAGLTSSVLALLATRMLLGLSEGPVLPIAQSIMSIESTPSRRGFNLGFIQNVGAFALAQLVGPIVLIRLADHFGWRTAFFLTIIPGLFTAVLIWRMVREPNEPVPAAAAATVAELSPKDSRSVWRQLTRNYNVVLCGFIAGAMGSWIILQVTFLPLYLTRVAHLSVKDMGIVMSMIGASGCIASVVLPLLSDRIGRKPVLVTATLVGLIMPLGVLLMHGSFLGLAAVVFLGSATTGSFPLYISIIPSESVGVGLVAGALGLMLGMSELFGGILMPTIAGHVADVVGLQAPLWIATGATLIAAVFAMMLRETAPRRLAVTRGFSNRNP